MDRRERNKRSRMEEAEVERQIEEDQAKLAEDSDGRTSEKPLQAAINRVVKKARTTPNSSISDKAKMLTTVHNRGKSGSEDIPRQTEAGRGKHMPRTETKKNRSG